MAKCSVPKRSKPALTDDVSLACMLHPRAFRRREKVVHKMKERLREQVETDFVELQRLFSETKSKERAFWNWCLSHADTQYPGLGDHVAYAVPHFFIGRQDIKNQRETGLFTHIQESQIRGDAALRRVGMAFRLLSTKRETERLKKANSGPERYPLFIMGNILNEHILKWPERVLDVYPDIVPLCPDMAKCPGKEFTPYYVQPTETNVRGEIDLMVLDRHAHVIFFEVKAFGTYPAQDKDAQLENKNGKAKKKSKWQESYDQLQTSRNNFRKMFPEEDFKDIKIHGVIAMPNICLTEAEQQFGFHIKDLEKDLVYMLTKEDMIEDNMKVAESEYDLSKLEQWWDKHLPSTSTTELSPDLMKIIVARYIGTLSRPLGMELNQQRNHIKTPCDAIEFASTIFKSICFSFNEDVAQREHQTVRNILKYHDEEKDDLDMYKRSHLKGTSGSRRTTLTILKANHFLCNINKNDSTTAVRDHDRKTSSKSSKTKKELKQNRDSKSVQIESSADGSRHVIVVDIYRGCPGRPAGIHLYRTITDTVPCPTKVVHHLPLDTNDITEERFHEMVEEITNSYHILPENLMFIVNEIPPLQLWGKVLIALEHEKYQRCHVWIVDGLMPENLEKHEEKFHQINLKSMCRIPPTILKVLYHVDWCEDKDNIYQIDECGEGTKEEVSDPPQSANTTTLHTKLCWSTRGPIPLCIRHQFHETKMLKCTECAQELAELLIFKLKIVEKNGEFEGKVEDEAILHCSIIILFSIPLDLYKSSTDDFHVEITTSNYKTYAKEINNSPFIASLRSHLPSSVHVVTKLKEDEEHVSESDDANKKPLNKIRLCWTDRFQGLVSDVVIFLPSEEKQPADLTPSSHSEGKGCRKLPCPGTVPDLEEVPQFSKQPDSNERVSLPICDDHISDLSLASDSGSLLSCSSTLDDDKADEKNQEHRLDDKNAIDEATECKRRQMAHQYWSTEDIERYTEWDKTQLVCAGSRCTGQLILMVP